MNCLNELTKISGQINENQIKEYTFPKLDAIGNE